MDRKEAKKRVERHCTVRKSEYRCTRRSLSSGCFGMRSCATPSGSGYASHVDRTATYLALQHCLGEGSHRRVAAKVKANLQASCKYPL